MNIMSGGKGDAKSARDIRDGQRSDDASEMVRRHEENLRRLTTLVQALWHLVRDRLNLTDEELARLVEIQKLNTGGQSATLCQHCSRPLEKRLDHCLYCGNAITNRDLFEPLL